MERKTPDAFVWLCQWFHQDIFVLYHSFDQALLAFVTELDDPNKVALKTYLADLITSGASDEELEKLWKVHGAQFGFVEASSIRPLFAEVQRLCSLSPRDE
jgi:hypothetical protein